MYNNKLSGLQHLDSSEDNVGVKGGGYPPTPTHT